MAISADIEEDLVGDYIIKGNYFLTLYKVPFRCSNIVR